MLRSIGKQSEESVESVLKKERKAMVGRYNGHLVVYLYTVACNDGIFAKWVWFAMYTGTVRYYNIRLFFRTDATDSPDCLPKLRSLSFFTFCFFSH